MRSLEELREKMQTPEFTESVRKYVEAYFAKIDEHMRKSIFKRICCLDI